MSAPDDSPEATAQRGPVPRWTGRWIGVALALVVLSVVGAAGCGKSGGGATLKAPRQEAHSATSAPSESIDAPASDSSLPPSGTPAPSSVARDLATVPLTAIAAATKAGPSANPVRQLDDGRLRRKSGKPEVLYIGGEFCPYCAGERWPLTVALSKFGTFSGLRMIHSAESDVPTLTFVGSTYTSEYLTFTPVEMKGNERSSNGWADLETPTAAQKKLLTERGNGSIPFIDFGGRYAQSGGSVDVSTLIGKSQTVIASTLAAATTTDTDKSSLQGNVNLVAGAFIRVICKLTGDRPADVCAAASVH